MFEHTIRTLVDENFIYARALKYLGIDFYLYPDKSLKEICDQNGLDKARVIKTFYLFDRSHRFAFSELSKYPLEIVLEYLRHSHHLFIKETLPYIAELINKYPEAEDLQLIFPEFVQEFIEHIYEEEDTLFHYINKLVEIDKDKFINPAYEFWKAKSLDLEGWQMHHEGEDELSGIRALVSESSRNDLHWEVIRREIKAFDREMWYHAEIENKILFPSAIKLQNKVLDKLVYVRLLN